MMKQTEGWNTWHVDEASRLARALYTTHERYQAGCMTHSTWKSHMASLWGTVDHYGLRPLVITALDVLRGVASSSEV
jgi:hypothetical protein